MATAETQRERELQRHKKAEVPADPILEAEEGKLLEEWDGGIARRTISFYHAEGAPYLDNDGKIHPLPPPEELEELQRQGLAVPPTILEAVVGEVVPIRDDAVLTAVYPAKAPSSRAKGAGATRQAEPARKVEAPKAPREARPSALPALPSTKVKKPADYSGIEELVFLALNSVFPGGVKIPIHREGIADLDVIIKGKDIMIDFQGPLADAPALTVWRITFAYEGEPLAVYGRGVKGDVKVFKIRVIKFLWRAMVAKRKRKKAERKAARDGWGALARS